MLKTIRWYAAALGSVTLLACQNEGPSDAFIGGTWTGHYTNSAAFHGDQAATFTFTQSGAVVSGQLSLSGGGLAIISGTMNGSQLTATMNFSGSCPGNAASQATVVHTSASPLSETGTIRLDGTYQLTDCSGPTTGTYTVSPQ